MADDDLSDFEVDTFTSERQTRTIYRQGSGPAVIVIAELPGITPKVLDFARMVSAIGCTAVLPHLFGIPGKEPSTSVIGSVPYLASSFLPSCISKEFTVLATGKTSPIVTWLRALAAHEHERCGGPGVGAVGMCFTGGYALAMAVDDRLLAPVLAEPSMPIPITPKQARSIDISAEDFAVVKDRCANDGLTVIGMRFKSDRLVPKARFEHLKRELGDAFVAIELEDADANPDAATPPHSVLTEHLIDEPGTATRAAVDEVLDLFRSRLLVDE